MAPLLQQCAVMSQSALPRRFHFTIMAANGMSYFAIVACLSLYFSSQSIDAIDFHFDDRSCDSLLPQTDAVTPGRPNDPNLESPPEDVFPKTDRKSSQNDQQSQLVASNEAPTYTIITQTEYYGPDKLSTVTLGNGEFNGFIIQARQSKGSAVSGTFTDPPPGVKILRCGTGSSANTAVSTDTSPKTSVKLTWKSPSGNLGDIEFVATFVKNATYWPNVKSSPLTLKEFPDELLPVPALLQAATPDLGNCGRTKTCYRYSGTSGVCKSDDCTFVFVSEVQDDYVVFTLGGRFTESKGYVGVAFTNMVFGKLELIACVKEFKDIARVQLYVAKDIESEPQEQFQILQSSAISIHGDNGEHVWCRFRRAMRITDNVGKDGPRLSDFTQPQTMMFLRGPLKRNSDGILKPELGKSAVFAEHQWNRTAVVDTLVTVDGVSRGEPLIGLILVSIVVTFFHAASN